MSAPPRIDGVSAVFFDLDDTLCAYWSAARKGLREAFEAHAVPGVSTEDMERLWAEAFREFYPQLRSEGWYEPYLASGEPTRTELMRRALAKAGVDDEALARTIGDAYAQSRLAHLRLFPDALPVLEVLKERFRLGLITNGPADVQRDEIDALRLRPWFETILIEGEMGMGKPAVEVFRLAEEQVSASAAECLFVGNSYAHDVRPALEAGWVAVWLRRPDDRPPSSDGGKDSREVIPPGAPAPDAIIGNLSDLLDLLPRR